jgi:hypothetical protein
MVGRRDEIDCLDHCTISVSRKASSHRTVHEIKQRGDHGGSMSFLKFCYCGCFSLNGLGGLLNYNQ